MNAIQKDHQRRARTAVNDFLKRQRRRIQGPPRDGKRVGIPTRPQR